jgi:beta-lactam-binding protein with PASTA domain
MGRCTVTKGQRRIGRTIRKLENSVELSSKEGKAKLEEQKFKQKTQTSLGYTDDSPIQNLRDQANRQKDASKQ